MKTLLFLCTGNYYRSRYAEELFNHGAGRAGLAWTGFSRGLAIERGAGNVGPLSPLARQAAKEGGLGAQAGDRFPQQCSASDLQAASHIVALYETEHRPLLRERFFVWRTASSTGKSPISKSCRPRSTLCHRPPNQRLA